MVSPFIYVFIVSVIIAVCLVKARFWARQPVRLWWTLPQKHRVDGLPPKKYIDHANINSFKHDIKSETAQLVEYLQTQTNDVYYPNKPHILAYFEDAYISVYGTKDIEGCIVSRPVDLRIDKRSYRGFFHESMASQKDDVSRKLIATHATNLAQVYPEAPLVFTATSPLWFVLPVLQYEVRWVQTRIFRKYRMPGVAFVKVTDATVHLAVEWWKTNRFDFEVAPTVAQLVAWLQSKTASVYLVIQGGDIAGCFYFKKALMVEKNRSVIDCCGAIFGPYYKDLIFPAFASLMHRVRRTNPILRLHLVSHLTPLAKVPYFKKTMAYYYMYRYKAPAHLDPKNCFVY